MTELGHTRLGPLTPRPFTPQTHGAGGGEGPGDRLLQTPTFENTGVAPLSVFP